MVVRIRLVLVLLGFESLDGIKSASLARHAINTDTVSEAAHTANDEIHGMTHILPRLNEQEPALAGAKQNAETYSTHTRTSKLQTPIACDRFLQEQST